MCRHRHRNTAGGAWKLRSSKFIICGMTEEWNEYLRCPNRRKTGMASLSLNDDARTVTVLSVPDGFQTVQKEYGPNFQCETCNVAAEP